MVRARVRTAVARWVAPHDIQRSGHRDSSVDRRQNGLPDESRTVCRGPATYHVIADLRREHAGARRYVLGLLPCRGCPAGLGRARTSRELIVYQR